MARGFPDYSRSIVPAKSELLTGQSMFHWSEIVSVSASSYNTATVYTVPTGKKLIITGIDVSCERSFITLLVVAKDAAVVHAFWYDTRGFMPITEGAIDFAAGTLLKRLVYNYDASNTNSFRFNILGYTVDA